ncbi:hypothetical protein [Ectobacillus funiculus]|uniref:hypothetical protein n=1 Tax=Ectobacillus funiculus TaxID=137993 RepID=UPI00101D9DE1|nr:hypothetical protein [Ectobacillus funiculus]
MSVFTYHKKTSAIAFYVMLIHALIIESVGFHFLLHSWNPIVALVALILNLYTLLLFLAEIQALRLAPFILTDNHLYLQVGVMKRLKVSLQDIKSIHAYEGPEKEIFDAVLVDFMKEQPAFEITFHTPQTAQLLYGFTKTVTKVHLRPDKPQQFYTVLTENLSEIYENDH